jgi:hypothetical protein
MAWENGTLHSAVIQSRNGGPCRIRSSSPIHVQTGGVPISVSHPAPGIYEFATQAGGAYRIRG